MNSAILASTSLQSWQLGAGLVSRGALLGVGLPQSPLRPHCARTLGWRLRWRHEARAGKQEATRASHWLASSPRCCRGVAAGVQGAAGAHLGAHLPLQHGGLQLQDPG